jgi:hypothetical protein
MAGSIRAGQHSILSESDEVDAGERVVDLLHRRCAEGWNTGGSKVHNLA